MRVSSYDIIKMQNDTESLRGCISAMALLLLQKGCDAYDRIRLVTYPGGWSNLYDLLPEQRAWGLMQKIAKSNGVLTQKSNKGV